MKRKVVGYYDYTVILTYCGMLLAFSGILYVLHGKYWEAVYCLMFAGVCDMFDGQVASTKKRTDMEKRFGIQIDSLSDLISFGVLPGIFCYMIADKRTYAGMIAGLFVLCALIRLAYFNVLEEERQKEAADSKKTYLGIPVTTIAVALPAVYLMYDYGICRSTIWFPVHLIFMGVGYLCPVEIKKPGIVGKIGLIVVGVLEMLAMLLFMGWDAV